MTTNVAGHRRAVPDSASWIAKKSHFLFGPRQTGKSTLVRASPSACLRPARRRVPGPQPATRAPRRGARARDRIVVIDEVQRLPEILNEVHRLIEERGTRFLLTGSSARKLRRGGVNLLGGRARTRHLHPLPRRELGSRFDLGRAIARGLLPSVYFSDDPGADLEAYAGTYLQQEIVAEGRPATSRVQPLPEGGRRLQRARSSTSPQSRATPRCRGRPSTSTSRSCGTRSSSTRCRPGRARRAQAPRLAEVLLLRHRRRVAGCRGGAVDPRTPEFGPAFETWLLHELVCHRDYAGGAPVSHWRSASGYEVDFVLGDHTAIEVKAKENVAPRELRGLPRARRGAADQASAVREPRAASPPRRGRAASCPTGTSSTRSGAGSTAPRTAAG